MLGMTFQSEHEAHRFYNAFASITRFPVIKQANYWPRKIGGDHSVSRIMLKCNKSGQPRDQKNQKSGENKPIGVGVKRRKYKKDIKCLGTMQWQKEEEET